MSGNPSGTGTDPEDSAVGSDEFGPEMEDAIAAWLLDPNAGTVEERVGMAESLDRYDLVDRIRDT